MSRDRDHRRTPVDARPRDAEPSRRVELSGRGPRRARRRVPRSAARRAPDCRAPADAAADWRPEPRGACTARWSSRSPRSSSWRTSTAASARRTSARRSRRRSASRSRNGSRIRSAGTPDPPDDKQRWSIEAAEMFSTGKPLRSAYRVHGARRRVVWFHCEAKMVRREDGRPWFIHGVGVRHHRSQAGRAGAAGGAQRPVRHPRHGGRAGRRARAPTGGSCASTARASGPPATRSTRCGAARLATCSWCPRRSRASAPSLAQLRARDAACASYEATGSSVTARRAAASPGRARCCRGAGATPEYIIATGIDITERKRLERAILEISAPGAAPDRAGSPRRPGPAPDRHRVHEQGAGAEAGGAARCRKRPRRAQDRAAGERGDQRDARAGARAACRWCPTRTG